MNDYLFEQSRSLLMNNRVDISRKRLHYEQMKTAYPTYIAYLTFMKPKHLQIDLMLHLAKDGIMDLHEIVRGLDIENLHKIEAYLQKTKTLLSYDTTKYIKGPAKENLILNYVDWNTMTDDVDLSDGVISKSIIKASTHQYLKEDLICRLLEHSDFYIEAAYNFYKRVDVIQIEENMSVMKDWLVESDLDALYGKAMNKTRFIKAVMDKFPNWVDSLQLVPCTMTDLVDYAVAPNPSFKRFVDNATPDYAELLLALKIEGSRVAVEYVNKNFGFPDYLYDLLAVDFSYDDIELERLRLDRGVGESDNKARNFKI